MLEHLTGDDLFALIKLLRASDKRTVILLEGGSDCDALDPHIDSEHAHSLPGHSRTTVERAIELVDDDQTERVVALVDRDWSTVLFPQIESENLFLTDLYDLDATILLSGDVLDRVLSSLTDRSKREQFLKEQETSARDILVKLAGVMGTGRYVVARDQLQVNFRRLPAHACVDSMHCQIEVSSLAAIAIRKSTSPKCDETQLANAIRAELQEQEDLAEFCSGHDLAGQIASMVRKVWGGAKISGDLVESTLRAALDCRTLKSTGLYRDIKEWADNSETVIWSCP